MRERCEAVEARVRALSPRIGRAIAVGDPERDAVTVYLVAAVSDPERFLAVEELTVDDDLLGAVANELAGTAAVRQAGFSGVSIVAQVERGAGLPGDAIEHDIRRRLYAFINPLVGGTLGTGWNSADPLDLELIRRRILAAEGVASVRILRAYRSDPVTGQNEPMPLQGGETLPPDILLLSGTHIVHTTSHAGLACPNCGAETDPDLDYCERCGHQLGRSITYTVPVLPPPTGRPCAECGAVNDTDRDFCVSCGASLRWNATDHGTGATASEAGGAVSDDPNASIADGPGAVPPPPPQRTPPPQQTPLPPVDPGPPVSAPPGIPLVEGFRYIHEPLIDDADPIPFLADGRAIERLKSRITHSNGGSFLVTGFRGVGKTTLVMRALREVEAVDSGSVDYLPVVLNVARPMSVDQLLFEVVRRLFEALIDRGILEALAPDVRRALILAYARTSLSFKETRSRATEVGQTLGIGANLPGATPITAVLSALTPKIGFSRKRTDSMATEASFLAYTHGDVEHDFLRILDLLNRPQRPPLSRRRRLVWLLRGGAQAPWRGRVVVVLDELDKLSDTEEGRAVIKSLLVGLKNVLTASQVHFVFVGGPELHDAAFLDAASGAGVYEGVFAYQLYVPCVWDRTGDLIERVVTQGALPTHQRDLLERHLMYKGRGIPRLFLAELNDLVRWDGGSCYLELDQAAQRRMAFFARLQLVLSGFLGAARQSDMLSLAIEEDRWRLGAYYIMDWILRRRARAFTLSEILALDEGTAGDWLTRTPAGQVQELVDHLVRHRILRVAWSPATGTLIGDAPQETVYELVLDVDREIAAVAAEAASGAVAQPVPSASPAPAAQNTGSFVAGVPAPSPAPPRSADFSLGTVDADRYELLSVIGRGGMGTVYRARDRRLGRTVAIKLLEAPYLLGDENVKRRFRREASIARNVTHRNIVETYDAFEERDGRLGIVMQLVEGVSLRQAIPMPPPRAVRVAIELLGALQYLADCGMARIDLKPENVILVDAEQPVVVDLGLVKVLEGVEANLTAEGVTVGTPAYMSPEQAMGTDIDIRSDMHALGLVLFEMISGRQGYDAEQPMMVLMRIVNEDLDLTPLKVSPELRAVIGRAVARERDERFASPADMRDALRRTPEGAASDPAGSALTPAGGAAARLIVDQPPDRRAGEPAGVTVTPGDSGTITGVVRNESAVVDNYDLAVRGVPEGWVSIVPATSYLVPYGAAGAYEERFTVTIQPPRSPEALAGSRDIEIVAWSRAYGTEADSVAVEVTITPYADASVLLTSAFIQGAGKVRTTAIVQNWGNARTEFRLRAEDANGQCVFMLSAPALALGVGETEAVVIVVRALTRRWIGRPTTHHFGVSTDIDAGNGSWRPIRPPTLGVYTQVPLVSGLTAAMVAIAICLVVLALILLL